MVFIKLVENARTTGSIYLGDNLEKRVRLHSMHDHMCNKNVYIPNLLCTVHF